MIKENRNKKIKLWIWICLLLLALVFLCMGLWLVSFCLFMAALPMMPKKLKSIRLENLPVFQLLGGLVGFCGVLAIMFLLFSSDARGPASGTRQSLSSKDVRVIVAVVCTEHVKKSLKSPRSAEFPWDYTVAFDGYTARMSSYVDAQNSYEANIRSQFVCVLEYNGGDANEVDNWTMKEVTISN